MYEYEFRFSVNLAKVVSAVGTMLDSINESMALFGFPEKLVVRSDIVGVRMTAKRALADDEQVGAANIILVALREKFPNFEVQYEGCQRYPTLGAIINAISDA